VQLASVPIGRVVGKVVDETGTALGGAEVRLVNLDEPTDSLSTKASLTAADGSFSFSHVAPGQYRVKARRGLVQRILVTETGEQNVMTTMFAAPAGAAAGRSAGPFGPPSLGAQLRWAQADISVAGSDPQGLTLTLQRGATVSGRLAFDGSGASPTDLSRVRVIFTSTELGDAISASGTVTTDGAFTATDVAPGSYRVALLGAPGWRPKSFDIGGRDALDFLLTVPPSEDVQGGVLTLTTRRSMLSGTLTGGTSGSPISDCTIIVFADDRRYWTPHSRRIQATRPATNGRFSFANLPAGSYRLVAVDDLEDGRWFDPAVLDQLAGAAVVVSLADGESRTQDVRVAR
jgi:hypothetical protein